MFRRYREWKEAKRKSDLERERIRGYDYAAGVLLRGEGTPCLLYTSPSPRD